MKNLSLTKLAVYGLIASLLVNIAFIIFIVFFGNADAKSFQQQTKKQLDTLDSEYKKLAQVGRKYSEDSIRIAGEICQLKKENGQLVARVAEYQNQLSTIKKEYE